MSVQTSISLLGFMCLVTAYQVAAKPTPDAEAEPADEKDTGKPSSGGRGKKKNPSQKIDEGFPDSFPKELGKGFSR